MSSLVGKIVIVKQPWDGRVVTGRCICHIGWWITLRFRSGGVIKLREEHALAIIEEN